MANDPLLYRRKIEEISRTIEKQLGGLTWQSQPRGPGHGFVQLFGRLAEVIINRLNQSPEQHFRAFLTEAGIDRLPPRPAHTELTFTPAADGPPVVQVRQGAQVATRPAENQPAVVFETARDLNAIPTDLARCVVIDQLNYSDRSAEARGEADRTFAAFQGETERARVLYIGHDSLFSFPDDASRENARLVLAFSFAEVAKPACDGGWRLEWLYWTGEAWAKLEQAGAEIVDGTRHFSRDGEVRFHNLPPLAPVALGGVQSLWLAARLTGGTARRCLPRIANVELYRAIRIPPPEGERATALVPFPAGLPGAARRGRPQRLYHLGHASVFDFADPIDRRRATFVLHLAFERPGGAPIGDDPQLQWLYWTGEKWADLKASGALVDDRTERWSNEGQVRLSRLPPLAHTPVNEVDACWLAVRLSGGTQAPILREVQIDRIIPAEVAPVEGALAAVQAGSIFVPLAPPGPFMPLGPQPASLDTFYLRADEAFTKPGALVTLSFTLEGLPAEVEDTSELDKLKIEWEYHSSDGWTRLGTTVRGCPTLESYNLDTVEGYAKPVVVTVPFSRRKVLEYAVPPGVDPGNLPEPFRVGKLVTDIYTGEHFIQIPVPDECASLPDELLISGCYTAARLNFRDKTCAFTAPGEVVVQFRAPMPESADPLFAPTVVNGQMGYWLRARVAEGSYDVPPPRRRGLLARGLFGQEPFQPSTPYPPVVEQVLVTYSDYDAATRPAPPTQCRSKTDERWRDHGEALRGRQPFAPYTAIIETGDLTKGFVTYEEPGLYLCFNPLLPDSTARAFPPGYWIQLRFDVFEQAARARGAIHWEYWNGRQWRMLQVIDDTFGLDRQGYLGFVAPDDHAVGNEFGHVGYWLRIRPTEPFAAPLLGSIRLNSVPAVNAETTTYEVLGSSMGERNQRFTLARSPVLPDVEIEVREPDQQTSNEAGALAATEAVALPLASAAAPRHEGWVRWERTLTFLSCGPESRCYTLDPQSGEIRFGDGRRGMIPPPGAGNIRAKRYRVHRGEGSNLMPGLIIELHSPTGALNEIQSVTNLEPAAGGSAVEAIPKAKARGPQTLKHRQRAVTREDYEWLALEIDGVERAYCLPSRDADGLAQPGWVTVVVTPKPIAALPGSADRKPVPTPALVRALRAHLEHHALTNLRQHDAPPSTAGDTDQIHVTGPDYLAVKVTAHVVADQPEQVDQVKLAVHQRLDELLHPLRGGPGRTGWQPGRDVHLSEIVAEIEHVPGVDHVAHAALAGASLLQQCLRAAEATMLAWPMPAGSQVSTFDEAVKLVLANPLPAGAMSGTVVVYGFKAGDRAAMVAEDNTDLSGALQISHAQPYEPSDEKDELEGFTILFEKTVASPRSWAQPAMALRSCDHRVRLPIVLCHFQYDTQKRLSCTGVTVHGLTAGEPVSLVHPLYRYRRSDFVSIVAVEPCDGLQRIFVPDGHLVFSGEHEIEVGFRTV